MIDYAFSQKIASGNTRLREAKLKRVVQRQRVKGVKPAELLKRDQVPKIDADIESGFSKVDVYAVDNAVYELFQVFHKNLLVFAADNPKKSVPLSLSPMKSNVVA